MDDSRMRNTPYPLRFEVDPTREFCALLFPCEVVTMPAGQSADVYRDLKLASLFFDKVFVLVPELIMSDFFCPWMNMNAITDEVIEKTKKHDTLEYRLWRERFSRIRAFIDGTQQLADEGILFFVNPLQVMAQPSQTTFYSLPSLGEFTVDQVDDRLQEVVFHSIVADLNDTDFRSHVARGYPYSDNGFAVFKDQGEINWLKMLASMSEHKEDAMIRLATQVGFNKEFKIPIISKPPCVGFDNIVSPVLGMAVIMAHVLSFCIANNVYPVSSSPYYLQLLAHKFGKITGSDDYRGLMSRFNMDRKLGISTLGLEILRSKLPTLELNSFDDVCHLRSSFKGELVRFRQALAKYSVSAASPMLSERFFSECAQIAQLEVEPAIQELVRSIGASKDKAVLSALKKVRSAKPAIPLVASLLAGIPIQYALAITAGLIGLETYVEYAIERNDLRSNGLTYVLDLGTQMSI